MKIKISKSQWEKIGNESGWMKTAQIKDVRLEDDLAAHEEAAKKIKEELNPPTLNGKPILNPQDAQGENLYKVAIGSIVNTGLIGFDGYVYAFDKQEAIDKVFDKYPNLGIPQEEVGNYEEDELSYGGNDGIPYVSEDLRELTLVRRAGQSSPFANPYKV